MERQKKGGVLAIFLLIFGSISVPIRAMEEISEKPLLVSDLSLDEKIGQLLMIATVSNTAQNMQFMGTSPYQLSPKLAEAAIEKHHVGGVIFLGASMPKKQIECIKQLKTKSKHPLLIAQDLEWGLSMRHTQDVITFPKALTLGALSEEDDAIIYELGREIGYQCKSIGVHMNMAPVADVNSNQNSIIGVRSFGDDPKKVSHKAALFMKGMKDVGIVTCAKHFPGHNTGIDSHEQLPIVGHPRKHLDKVDLAPFRHLIEQGVPAIMTGHLVVPAITGSETIPATLSSKTIDLLRNELGFDGLIITDGLGMDAVHKGRKPGEAEFEALKAGHDLLLCPVDIEATIERIKKGLNNGEILEENIDEHVERILRVKNGTKNEKLKYNKQALRSTYAKQLKKRLYESAITLVHDGNNHLPLQSTPKESIPVLSYGISGQQGAQPTPFVQKLKEFLNIEDEHHPFLPYFNEEQTIKNFEKYKQIIVSIHLPSRSGRIELEHQNNQNTVPPYVSLINKLAGKVILVLFGSPYNLKHMPHTGTTIVAYENEPEAQKAAAEVLAGKREARGILPVEIE